MLYDTLLALHIVAFTAWMAAMFYLPRLLVYHAGVASGSEMSETFKVMERRLLKAIATPAMVATLILGIVLATMGEWWTSGWLHGKLLLVFGMAACHGVLARQVRLFAADQNVRSGRYYRILNEVPTVLLVGIVLLAVLKPF